jgi:two-component system response regulator
MATPATILLVEDNPDDEELTLRVLRNAGLANEIFAVRDGAEALEYLFCEGQYASRDPSAPPAVVLLDLRLPKMSGLEVLRALRANPSTRLQPVVILTSSDMERDASQAYELGANSFVTKPVDIQDFTNAIKRVGLYWMLINRGPYA